MGAKRKAKKKAAGRKARTAKKINVPRTPAVLHLPCTTFSQAGQQLVLLSVSAKLLYSICVINQREEDKDEGYQRALSPARADRIARFIDANNLLPTSVLVSFESDVRVMKSGSELQVPNKSNAGWIIDGQHRLEGAHKSQKDIDVPVVAFIGLPIDDQIKCFVTINKEQKGVPSSLYLDLLKHLPSQKTEAEAAKERAADLGQLMKRDEQSPFYARIVSTTSPKQGELSLTNFVRKVAPLLRRDGRLSGFRDEDRAQILDNYYRGLEQVFPRDFRETKSIFYKTLGFGALISVLPTFLDATLSRSGGGFAAKDVADTFRLVKHFDFSSWHERGTGTQVEAAAADDLRTELIEHLAPSGNLIRLS
jgi:DGQHR domain-containing protein